MIKYQVEHEITLKYLDIGDYGKSKVYPVKLLLPQDWDLFNFDSRNIESDRLMLLSGKMTLIEYLLGSILVYKPINRIHQSQLNTILPLILSANPIDIFNYTHRVMRDSGFIALYIPVKRRFMIEFQENMKKYIDVDESTGRIVCKEYAINNIFDPKTLLKIITQNYFPRLSMIINPKIRSRNYTEAGNGRLRSIIPFIRKILFEVPKHLSIFGIITTNVKLVFSGITPRLLDTYIGDYLLTSLRSLVKDNKGKRDLCFVELLLNSFLDYVNNYIRQRLNSRYGININNPVMYRLDGLISAIYIGLIELGAHALSHMLMKYLSSRTHISTKSIQELIFLNAPIPEDIERSIINELLLGNAIVDGYIFRKIESLDSLINGVLVAAVVREPYSYKIIENTFNGDPYESINNFSKFLEDVTVIYTSDGGIVDKCYVRWFDNRYPMKVTIESIANRLRKRIPVCNNVEEGTVIIDLQEELEKMFGTDTIEEPNDVYWKFYVPLMQLRRYIYRVLYEAMAKNYTSPNIDECKKEIMRVVKPYLPAIYASTVPDCFDGCYNCVLTDACSTPSPLVREWIVSKWAMKYLLDFFGRNSDNK